MKEFNQMVHQQNAQHDDNNVATEAHSTNLVKSCRASSC